MFNEASAQEAPPSVYINLVAAHELIVQLRDRIRFVSSIVDAIGEAKPEISIRTELLAACVSSLVEELDDVAEAVRWSKVACAN